MTVIRSADDVRAVWRKHCGDKPVPTRDADAERVRRALAEEQAETVRRAQLEAARRRVEGANWAPWPDAEQAWLEAIRLARSVFATP
ncbi:hypothetical protein AB0H58_16730 [Nocardia neocaledoniensis]|uniref:hypothetical protein n=1 Tax=Nocardia neocaledoniensis TaxID=236511 RepID=UPI0033FA7070